MELSHLSATSVRLWQHCPAAWVNRYVDGTSTGRVNPAADFGSRIHSALEDHVQASGHLAADAVDQLSSLWIESTGDLDSSLRAEGERLLRRWSKRQDWNGREVLTAEMQDAFFELETPYGLIPFKYIIDRVDEVQGEVEIIDYKSGFWQLDSSAIRNDIQARSYATAAWIHRPDQNLFWVVFDYLRYEPIGTAFRGEECEQFYLWLCSVATQILEMDVDQARNQEVLNSTCRFCPRKLSCSRLAEHRDASAATMTREELVERRIDLEHTVKAIKAAISELDDELEAVFVADDLEFLEDGGGRAVTLASRRLRVIDQDKVRNTLSPSTLHRYTKLSLEDLEELIQQAEDEGDFETARLLRKAISTRVTGSKIKVVSNP